ncbi:MAG: hypothetical protein P4M04_01095 [Acidobacteriota bacterium]|nr:hypothetical protein [Acidobacteriota bacterium]
MRSCSPNATLRAVLIAAAILLLLCATASSAQQVSKRLILKDGSYQSVVKYEIQGDRVHYLSAERYEWEDIPTSLIDWDATKKYESDLSSGKLVKRRAETPEEREEREKEESNSPEVAPGLRLPGTGGVFLFDLYQSKPELAEIVQNGSELNKARQKNTLRASINPLSSAKQNFEIKGEHALVQSHQERPIIYIDIDEGPQNDVALGDRFRLVRAKTRNGVRIIGNLKVTFSGKVSQESSLLPTTASKIGTGEWVKLVPNADLPPGEYVVVEMLGPQEMNLYVWDFGVNFNAPANPSAWQPAEKAASSN